MRVATWNVNSIRQRLPQVLDLLTGGELDVILLQELKCEEGKFPFEEIENLNYNCAVFGQKAYNGVAVISRYKIEEVIKKNFGGDERQARYIEAVLSVDTSVVRVASVYVPNGQSVESENFNYKMRFFDDLYEHATHLLGTEENLIIGGDFNVAPFDIDVYAPDIMNGTVCFHYMEREKIRCLMNSGYYDAFRLIHPEEQIFSWWDYRGGGFERNKGLRLDFVFLSPAMANVLEACDIDTGMRSRKPASDHAPVVASLIV